MDSEKSIAGFLNDPDVNSKVDYLLVGQGTEEAKGRMGERCVALHEALLRHQIKHEYYVGGYAGHDWATWRHLVYYRFLPGLWRTQTPPAPEAAADSRPARANVLGAEYPRVTGDSRGVFRFKALAAQRVQVDITGAKYDMARDHSGVWSVTTPPLVPGFHYRGRSIGHATRSSSAIEHAACANQGGHLIGAEAGAGGHRHGRDRVPPAL